MRADRCAETQGYLIPDVGKAEFARRLGRYRPQIDGLLDLNHTSRIGRVEAAFRALDKQIVIDIRDRAA